MTPAYTNARPTEAWEALPAAGWNAENARHLLRRMGWYASPPLVRDALARGLEGTLEHYYGSLRPFPEPYKIARQREEGRQALRGARMLPEEERRRVIRRQLGINLEAFTDYGMQWLQFAREPDNGPQEKWVSFLQNVFVVSVEKVKAAPSLHAHQDLLRERGSGAYPELCKAVSRSPAMINYLDLNRSRAGAPNENFARELFELFTLGEGHYTERDIKEAARAFTGYRGRLERFFFARREHDDGPKTIFGRTGRFDGDDVIDLAFEQPAARTFLPAEMLRFYLTEQPLRPEYLAALGEWWAGTGFDLDQLRRKVFASKLFYTPQFRGELIKSPHQLYLGLLGDLGLDVAPFPRAVLSALRSMGQPFYQPPNVRGWVGGRHWISSATLAARRQVVQRLFQPIDESALNADEQFELRVARANGRGRLFVEADRIGALARAEPGDTIPRLCAILLAGETDPAFERTLTDYLAQASGEETEKLRTVLIALLQSAQYQVC
jgi:hypothetical protein